MTIDVNVLGTAVLNLNFSRRQRRQVRRRTVRPPVADQRHLYGHGRVARDSKKSLGHGNRARLALTLTTALPDGRAGPADLNAGINRRHAGCLSLDRETLRRIVVARFQSRRERNFGRAVAKCEIRFQRESAVFARDGVSLFPNRLLKFVQPEFPGLAGSIRSWSRNHGRRRRSCLCEHEHA